MKEKNELIENEIFKNCFEIELLNNEINEDNIIYYLSTVNNNYEDEEFIINFELNYLRELINYLKLKYSIYANEEKTRFILIVGNRKDYFKNTINYKNESFKKFKINYDLVKDWAVITTE